MAGQSCPVASQICMAVIFHGGGVGRQGFSVAAGYALPTLRRSRRAGPGIR